MADNITNVTLLGEDDFLPAMENENRQWRKEHVTRGQLRSFDGTKLNYYVATPKAPKASIVIVHGMAEFWCKYHEYIWYLYQAGYQVFFMEQRGHGYSEGKVAEPDLIYVDNYKTYVEDLLIFIDNIVVPASDGLKKFMIAHSMGGAVGTLFLEKNPGYFDGVILSSPMLRMKAGQMSPAVLFLIKLYATLFGKKKKLGPKQKHFNPNTPIETSSAKSKPRFEYQLNYRRKDEHYQAGSATFGWAVASMSVTNTLPKQYDRIKIPVNIMTAGDDHLVDITACDEFKAKVPQAVIHHYPDSRHEIFNADEATRKQYFTDVLRILGEYGQNDK